MSDAEKKPHAWRDKKDEKSVAQEEKDDDEGEGDGEDPNDSSSETCESEEEAEMPPTAKLRRQVLEGYCNRASIPTGFPKDALELARALAAGAPDVQSQVPWPTVLRSALRPLPPSLNPSPGGDASIPGTGTRIRAATKRTQPSSANERMPLPDPRALLESRMWDRAPPAFHANVMRLRQLDLDAETASSMPQPPGVGGGNLPACRSRIAKLYERITMLEYMTEWITQTHPIEYSLPWLQYAMADIARDCRMSELLLPGSASLEMEAPLPPNSSSAPAVSPPGSAKKKNKNQRRREREKRERVGRNESMAPRAPASDRPSVDGSGTSNVEQVPVGLERKTMSGQKHKRKKLPTNREECEEAGLLVWELCASATTLGEMWDHVGNNEEQALAWKNLSLGWAVMAFGVLSPLVLELLERRLFLREQLLVTERQETQALVNWFLFLAQYHVELCNTEPQQDTATDRVHEKRIEMLTEFVALKRCLAKLPPKSPKPEKVAIRLRARGAAQCARFARYFATVLLDHGVWTWAEPSRRVAHELRRHFNEPGLTSAKPAPKSSALLVIRHVPRREAEEARRALRQLFLNWPDVKFDSQDGMYAVANVLLFDAEQQATDARAPEMRVVHNIVGHVYVIWKAYGEALSYLRMALETAMRHWCENRDVLGAAHELLEALLQCHAWAEAKAITDRALEWLRCIPPSIVRRWPAGTVPQQLADLQHQEHRIYVGSTLDSLCRDITAELLLLWPAKVEDAPPSNVQEVLERAHDLLDKARSSMRLLRLEESLAAETLRNRVDQLRSFYPTWRHAKRTIRTVETSLDPGKGGTALEHNVASLVGSDPSNGPTTLRAPNKAAIVTSLVSDSPASLCKIAG